MTKTLAAGGAIAASLLALGAGYLLWLSLWSLADLDDAGALSGLYAAVLSGELQKIAAASGAVLLAALGVALLAGRSWRRARLTTT